LFVFAGVASRNPGQGLLIGVVGPIIGILITAPLYFWFAAIAAGVATLVERSKG
jgi:ABC-type lipoprotein release transport system permease subunit